MKRISAAMRISIGIASLTATVLFAAQYLGMIPDATTPVLRGRQELCDTLAINCSVAAQRGDFEGIRAATEVVATRSHDILSIAIVQADGKHLVTVGDHERNWIHHPDGRSTPTHVTVPIFQGNERWGSVQVRFAPLDGSGDGMHWVLASFQNPVLKLTVFLGGGGMIAYFFYLRKMLQHLDPSAVIPDRVKLMLDTLAEGVLVLDTQERIVMANQAFARALEKKPTELQGKRVNKLAWELPDVTAEGEDKDKLTAPPEPETPPSAGTEVTHHAESAESAESAKGGESKTDGEARDAEPATPAEAKPLTLPWTTAIRSGGIQRGVGIIATTDSGKKITYMVNCAAILGGDGKPRGVLVTFDDVTSIEEKNVQLRHTLEMLEHSQGEVQRQNRELELLATTDPLTSCLNRRAFFGKFDQRFKEARETGTPLACIMVDVDYFKKINDRHGHSTGDQVLRQVSSLLRAMARDTDLVCRYGGEEFCVLMPGTDLDGVVQAAEAYRLAIEVRECAGLSVTASIGAAILGEDEQEPQHLLDKADKALYVSKRNGRNRVTRWEDGATEAAPEAGAAPGHGAEAGKPAQPAKEVEKTYQASEAIVALTSMLMYCDREQADHARRVADLCVATVKPTLTETECHLVEAAGLLHDIGKLTVPDGITRKAGKLTPEEWEVIRKHERMGVQMVNAAFGSAELTNAIRLHQAWFGGNPETPGMPTGTDLPLASRLLNIANAYDAMVSNRIYRRARTQEEAFAELKQCAGTQFDPALVEKFVEAVKQHGGNTGAVAEMPTISGRVLELKERLEQLARGDALSNAQALGEVAKELSVAASEQGLHDLAAGATALERSAAAKENGESPDLELVAKLTRELLATTAASGGEAVAAGPTALAA